MKSVRVLLTRHSLGRLRERFLREKGPEEILRLLNSRMGRAWLAPYLRSPGRYQLWYEGSDLLFLLQPEGEGLFRALTFMHVLRPPRQGEEVLVSYALAE